MDCYPPHPRTVCLPITSPRNPTWSTSHSLLPLPASPSRFSLWPYRCWCPLSSGCRILHCLCALVSWYCCMVSLCDGARPDRHAWVCKSDVLPQKLFPVSFVPGMRTLLAVCLKFPRGTQNTSNAAILQCNIAFLFLMSVMPFKERLTSLPSEKINSLLQVLHQIGYSFNPCPLIYQVSNWQARIPFRSLKQGEDGKESEKREAEKQ